MQYSSSKIDSTDLIDKRAAMFIRYFLTMIVACTFPTVSMVCAADSRAAQEKEAQEIPTLQEYVLDKIIKNGQLLIEGKELPNVIKACLVTEILCINEYAQPYSISPISWFKHNDVAALALLYDAMTNDPWWTISLEARQMHLKNAYKQQEELVKSGQRSCRRSPYPNQVYRRLDYIINTGDSRMETIFERLGIVRPPRDQKHSVTLER